MTRQKVQKPRHDKQRISTQQVLALLCCDPEAPLELATAFIAAWVASLQQTAMDQILQNPNRLDAIRRREFELQLTADFAPEGQSRQALCQQISQEIGLVFKDTDALLQKMIEMFRSKGRNWEFEPVGTFHVGSADDGCRVRLRSDFLDPQVEESTFD